MQQDTEQLLDGYGTIGVQLYDPAAMRMREAIRSLLRAWEEMHGLPRSFQTVAERNGDLKKSGHHNR
jgi:hypothetical protein